MEALDITAKHVSSFESRGYLGGSSMITFLRTVRPPSECSPVQLESLIAKLVLPAIVAFLFFGAL